MAHQAIIVYISQEGGEVSDLQDLVDGNEVELDWVGSLNGEDIPIKVRISDHPHVETTTTCRHCGRDIGQDKDGRWIDPEAGYDDVDGDGIWRETCDENHEDRIAAHEPVDENEEKGELPDAEDSTGWIDGVPQFWDANSKTWMAL